MMADQNDGALSYQAVAVGTDVEECLSALDDIDVLKISLAMTMSSLDRLIASGRWTRAQAALLLMIALWDIENA